MYYNVIMYLENLYKRTLNKWRQTNMNLLMDGWVGVPITSNDLSPSLTSILMNILTGIRLAHPRIYQDEIHRFFEFLQYENRAIGRFTW